MSVQPWTSDAAADLVGPRQTEIVMDWYGATFDALPGSWIVSFKNSPGGNAAAELAARQVATELGVKALSAKAVGRYWAEFRTDGQITPELVERVKASSSNVAHIEPNRLMDLTRAPNDIEYPNQWMHDNTGAFLGGINKVDADIDTPAAWDRSIGSRDQIVAFLDTGMQLDHPDLRDNLWSNPGEIDGNGIDDDGNGFIDDINGWDFIESDNDPDDNDSGTFFVDYTGHGTQVAGLIGAVGDNGLGGAGVNWAVSLLPVRVVGPLLVEDEQEGLDFNALYQEYVRVTVDRVVSGIDYVTALRESGVNIAALNASYGDLFDITFGSSDNLFTRQAIQAEESAIRRFIDTGGVFVTSAGHFQIDDNNNIRNNLDAAPNANDFVSHYPASYKIPGVITVTATDFDDEISIQSTDGFFRAANVGAQTVDLGAPGYLVHTTDLGDNYTYVSGTSFSTAVVSGAVALLKSIKPNASPLEIREALRNGADPVPALQGRTVSGGRLNVARSMDILGIAGPVVRSVLPGPVTGQIDPTTNSAVKSITVKFNKPMDQSKLAASAAELRRDGSDNIFGTGDDGIISVSSIVLSSTDPTQATVNLNVNSLPSQRLPIDTYRLTLFANVSPTVGFSDIDGNQLNGNAVSGRDEVYTFQVVPVTGSYETNDTLATATPVTFNASGSARFSGVTLGDGLEGSRDVDLFRIDMARGGLISAEITAKRLTTGSSLDSYLRLFNSRGEQLAFNDQFYGQDSYIEFYVPSAGSYYIGVSGFGNDNYNPENSGSGGSQSTGLYTLRIATTLNSDDLVTVASDFPAPLALPATGTTGVVETPLTITDTRGILDANVQIQLRHGFVSDLRVSLISPSGTQVVLFDRRGGSGQNITPTVFDDEASVAISTGTAPFAGNFRPDQPLNVLDGESAFGTWRLRIEDLAGGNTGLLDAWRLDLRVQNNIFGPFEANDTVPTANVTALSSLTGASSDSRTIDAAIGDGGFGALDRDIFTLNVAAGATMNAFVVPTSGALNTALRLFNSQGQQLLVSSPVDTTSARLDNFVFRDAGTYYIAVSEGANIGYNPFNVNSGTPAATTGNYSLQVSVANGVSDAADSVGGDRVSISMGSDGLFVSGTGLNSTGLRYDGREWLYRSGTPEIDQFLGFNSNGTVFSNVRVAGSQPRTELPFALTNESDAFNGRLSGEALFNGNVRMERSVTVGKTDSFVAIDLVMTNVGSTQLTNLSWMEGLNPEIGRNLTPSTSNTRNDIDAAGRLATATYINNSFAQGLTMGLAAPTNDTRARAMVISQAVVNDLRDPTQLLAMPPSDPNGASSDGYLTLVYTLGTLNPGQSTTMRYFIFLGNTPTEVSDLYAALNAGTGAGHLAVDPSEPATETLADGSVVPQLPYRYYFPEGFATPATNTFVPILNPNDQSARVVVIARYESGVRDQLLATFSGSGEIAPNSRSGVTLTNPTLFAAGTQLVRPFEGYAVEIRSDRPIIPTFSHYDTNLTTTAASIGESFTTRISDTWTFAQVEKSADVRDFVLYFNNSDQQVKVDTTFYPQQQGLAPITITQTVDAKRRLGVNVNDVAELPAGVYGVKIQSQQPIVATLSHYDIANRQAEGVIGLPNIGSTAGATSEGDLGVDATGEKFRILNTSSQTATVTLIFLFTTGSSFRWVETVPAQSQRVVDVGALPNFPIGQQYSMEYDSTAPVSISLEAQAFGDALISGATDQAYRLWGFGEGFRPRDGNSLVTETLKLFNPGSTDTIAEITLRYDNNLGSDSIRVVIPARRSFSLDIHELVTGPNRRSTEVWYGLTIKAADPIVASMVHADAFFPGAFSTLGTPLGRGVQI